MPNLKHSLDEYSCAMQKVSGRFRSLHGSLVVGRLESSSDVRIIEAVVYFDVPKIFPEC